MAERDEPIESPEAAMTRLEAALDRIERSAKPAGQTAIAAPADEAVLAARLDTLITTLRNALAEATG
jgi:hypothetical protein